VTNAPAYYERLITALKSSKRWPLKAKNSERYFKIQIWEPFLQIIFHAQLEATLKLNTYWPYHNGLAYCSPFKVSEQKNFRRSAPLAKVKTIYGLRKNKPALKRALHAARKNVTPRPLQSLIEIIVYTEIKHAL
jgi:hypothetical protein